VAIPPAQEEPVLVLVETGEVGETGDLEYTTTWLNGDVTQQSAESFLDSDGTFNYMFLAIAKDIDIRAALKGKTVAHLEAICEGQSWKVRLLILRDC
jgi:hypothetical protein